MTQSSAIGTAKANPVIAEPFGVSRRPLRTVPAVMQKAQALFPSKTALHLSEITGFSTRSCEAWLAGDAKIPSEAIGSLMRSDWGLEFIVAIMADSRPSWWSWLLKVSVTASVLRRRAADRRLLERALSADREMADAIARAETALVFQGEEHHRPYLDGLDALAGVSGGAVASTGKARR